MGNQAPGSTGPSLFSNVGGTNYTSTDGGATWTVLGGGGTVNVTSNLAGNGTVGTPLDLSAGNIATIGYAGSGWQATEAKAIRALVAAITQFREIPIATIPLGVTSGVATQDGALEGGGFKVPGVTASSFFSQSIFQTPKTGSGSASFRAILGGGGASGHDSQVELINSAGTHLYKIGRTNAVSSSKFTLGLLGSSAVNVAGLVNADSNVHIFRIVWGSIGGVQTIQSYVDGTLDASSTTFTQQSDEPFYVGAYCATTNEAVVSDAMVGYVG